MLSEITCLWYATCFDSCVIPFRLLLADCTLQYSDLPTSAITEPALTHLDDLTRSTANEASSFFNPFNQESVQGFLSRFPVDFFSPSTGLDDTTASVSTYEPMSIAGPGCSSSCPQCPIDPGWCSAACPSSGNHGVAQQDIESGLPSPSDISHPPALPLSYTDLLDSSTEPPQPSEPWSSPFSEGKRVSRPRLTSRSVTAPISDPDFNDGAQRPLSGRANHLMTEQRYRKNLNARLDQLKRVLSAVESNMKAEDDQHAGAIRYGLEADDKTQPSSSGKLTKSDVLLGAIQYIKQSEREKRDLTRTNEFLQQRVVALEKLIKCEDCALLKQRNWLNLQSSASAPFMLPDGAS